MEKRKLTTTMGARKKGPAGSRATFDFGLYNVFTDLRNPNKKEKKRI